MALPRSVWVCVVALVAAMVGLGLVTPLLRTLSVALDASPSQTLLLVTGYVVVLGVVMPFTSAVSSRFGLKQTMVAALALDVVCGLVASTAHRIDLVIWCRVGWGVGNALFLATVLAAVTQAAGTQLGRAVKLFEAATGFGIAAGPLVGGVLGAVTWRAAFWGAAVMMGLALLLLVAVLPSGDKPPRPESLRAPFVLLKRPRVLAIGIVAVCYNIAFLTMFGFTPFPLHLGALPVGLVYSGWGIGLVLTSMLLAPVLQRRASTTRVLAAALVCLTLVLLAMAWGTGHRAVLIAGVIACGGILGVGNSMVTELAMTGTGADSATASASYNFMRNAIPALAPWVAGRLAEATNDHLPYVMAAVASLAALAVLGMARPLVGEPEPIRIEAVGPRSIAP